MSNDKNRSSPGFSPPEIATPTYRGADRRRRQRDESEDHFSGRVRFDPRGNPIWEARVDVIRRRRDDKTVNLLKCLENDRLALEEERVKSEEELSLESGYDPYGHSSG
jgi:hypothetical protein